MLIIVANHNVYTIPQKLKMHLFLLLFFKLAKEFFLRFKQIQWKKSSNTAGKSIRERMCITLFLINVENMEQISNIPTHFL